MSYKSDYLFSLSNIYHKASTWHICSDIFLVSATERSSWRQISIFSNENTSPSPPLCRLFIAFVFGPVPSCHDSAIFFAAGDIKKTHRSISRQATRPLLQTAGALSLNCRRGPRDELRPAAAVNRFYGRRLRIYCNWTQFRRLVHLKWPAE